MLAAQEMQILQGIQQHVNCMTKLGHFLVIVVQSEYPYLAF